MSKLQELLLLLPDEKYFTFSRENVEKLAELEEEAEWVRKKLELPEDTKTFTGDISLAGSLHVLCSHAHGYDKYITSYKCDDKQGEIARLTVKVQELEEKIEKLKPKTLKELLGECKKWELTDEELKEIDL